MGTLDILLRRGGGGMLNMGTLFVLKQPTSSTPCTIGVSAGGAALLSTTGLVSSFRILLASSSRSGKMGDTRGVGDIGEKPSFIMTSYEGRSSPSESLPESKIGVLERADLLAEVRGDLVRSEGSSLLALRANMAGLPIGGGAFSFPLRPARRLVPLGRTSSFLTAFNIASAMANR